MRYIGVSFLAFFAVMQAVDAARLPVVNIGAGAISARAAFGEVVYAEPEIEKKVVFEKPKPLPVEQIEPVYVVADSSDDVLMPNMPSNDLWAKGKTLDLPIVPVKIFEEPKVAKIEYAPEPVAEMPKIAVAEDVIPEQISRLIELQKKADESIKVAAKKVEQSSNDRVVFSALPEPEIAKEETIVRRVIVSDVEEIPVEKSNDVVFKNKTDDFAKMSPTELKKAFKKTYLSENKHLSAYKMDDSFDVISDVTSSSEGFTAKRDLSEEGGVRPLEIKIGFYGNDSALSRDNYNLLTEYASIVVSNPKRAIQVSMPESVTYDADARKLAARRLSIIEQVLRDTGVSDKKIMPVLNKRNDDSFVLRVISSDVYQVLNQQQKNMFGDTSSKSYKSMSW